MNSPAGWRYLFAPVQAGNADERPEATVLGLPYPWCTREEILLRMPRLEGMATVRDYLQDVRPISPQEETMVARLN
jgi:hypothetical protein